MNLCVRTMASKQVRKRERERKKERERVKFKSCTHFMIGALKKTEEKF